MPKGELYRLSFCVSLFCRFHYYSVVSTSTSVIYFGGLCDLDGKISYVAEYKNLEWTKLGHLAEPRFGHRSIKIKNKYFVVGGSPAK